MVTSSFGRPGPDVDEPAETLESATPVLHVGEVHAELRLDISEETLRSLGSQIASMIASATKQGFEFGMAAALDPDGAGPGGEFAAGLPPLTDEVLRRAHGR